MPLGLEGLGRQPVTIATIVGPKSEDLPAKLIACHPRGLGDRARLLRLRVVHTCRRLCVFPFFFSIAVPQALPNVLTGEAPEEKHT